MSDDDWNSPPMVGYWQYVPRPNLENKLLFLRRRLFKSTARAELNGRVVDVMHACGHEAQTHGALPWQGQIKPWQLTFRP